MLKSSLNATRNMNAKTGTASREAGWPGHGTAVPLHRVEGSARSTRRNLAALPSLETCGLLTDATPGAARRASPIEPSSARSWSTRAAPVVMRGQRKAPRLIEMTAGVRLSPAASITTIEIATAGPSVPKKPSAADQGAGTAADAGRWAAPIASWCDRRPRSRMGRGGALGLLGSPRAGYSKGLPGRHPGRRSAHPAHRGAFAIDVTYSSIRQLCHPSRAPISDVVLDCAACELLCWSRTPTVTGRWMFCVGPPVNSSTWTTSLQQ